MKLNADSENIGVCYVDTSSSCKKWRYYLKTADFYKSNFENEKMAHKKRRIFHHQHHCWVRIQLGCDPNAQSRPENEYKPFPTKLSDILLASYRKCRFQHFRQFLTLRLSREMEREDMYWRLSYLSLRFWLIKIYCVRDFHAYFCHLNYRDY